jgi:ketopantoate reductase
MSIISLKLYQTNKQLELISKILKEKTKILNLAVLPKKTQVLYLI